jgi:hypothetical protein
VINESTASSLRVAVDCVALEEVIVKGRQTPVHAFRIDVYEEEGPE